MKVGIIGCGFVAPDHIRCLRRLKDIEIVGVADTNLDAAHRLSSTFEIPQVFIDTKKLLEVSKPDVVHLLTPPQTHKELAIQAMESGAHVLLEKPMAPSLEEADAIVTAAHKHNVKLALCHNFLFIPCLVILRF